VFQDNFEDGIKSLSFEIFLEKLLVDDQNDGIRRKAIYIVLCFLVQNEPLLIVHISTFKDFLFAFALCNNLTVNDVQQT
jgi:hypothetical protein